MWSDEKESLRKHFESFAACKTGSAIGQKERVNRYLEASDSLYDNKLMFTKKQIREALKVAGEKEKMNIGIFVDVFLEELLGDKSNAEI